MGAFGSLKVNFFQWGKDGEAELRSDTDPTRWQNIQAGTENVGWGEFVKFDVDPNAADGSKIKGSEVPGAGLKYPVVNVGVTLTDENGSNVGAAKLTADPAGEKEGEVSEGNPVHLNMNQYDQSHGYGIKVTCGNQANQKSEFKPANSGRCKVTVTFETQGVTGSASYFVS